MKRQREELKPEPEEVAVDDEDPETEVDAVLSSLGIVARVENEGV